MPNQNPNASIWASVNDTKREEKRDQLVAVKYELYKLALTNIEPYTPPVDTVQLDIGVELKASMPGNEHKDVLNIYKESKL